MFIKTSALEQENVSLKEQLEKEISSVNEKENYNNDIDNENLILLQKKGIKKKKNYYKINFN